MQAPTRKEREYYLSTLEATRQKIDDLKRQVELELATARARIAELQKAINDAKQQYDTACDRLGIDESSRDFREHQIVADAPSRGPLVDVVSFDDQARPIWELVAELGAAVSADQWSRVPSDLSKNLDHYLHGTPRRGE